MLLRLLCTASEPRGIGLQSEEALPHRFIAGQPTLGVLSDDADALETPLDRDGTTWLAAGPSYASPAALSTHPVHPAVVARRRYSATAAPSPRGSDAPIKMPRWGSRTISWTLPS